MDSNQKFIIAITALLMAGVALFVWRGDLQEILADVQVEAEPVEMSGTWVAKDITHITHRTTIHKAMTGEHFEGPVIIDRRVGNWRFEFDETPDHLVTGKGYWDITYPDGSSRNISEGHITGLVLDQHWISKANGAHIIFLLEVPPQEIFADTETGAWIQLRFSLKMIDGELVGFATANGLPSFFAAKFVLEKVDEQPIPESKD